MSSTATDEPIYVWIHSDGIRGIPPGARCVQLKHLGYKWVHIRPMNRKRARRIPRKLYDSILIETPGMRDS